MYKIPKVSQETLDNVRQEANLIGNVKFTFQECEKLDKNNPAISGYIARCFQHLNKKYGRDIAGFYVDSIVSILYALELEECKKQNPAKSKT